jgi:hypothetical protein
MPGIVEIHDLHVWEVTSGFVAVAAHVVVAPGATATCAAASCRPSSTSAAQSATRRSRSTTSPGSRWSRSSRGRSPSPGACGGWFGGGAGSREARCDLP